MKRDHIYTIHYEAGEEVEKYLGCKFDSLITWDLEEGPVRGAVMPFPMARPSPAVFWETRFVT